MTTVNVHTAKTNLSALLHSVEERHERIVISRYGKAVAELVLVSAISAWEIGLKQAKGKLSLPLPRRERGGGVLKSEQPPNNQPNTRHAKPDTPNPPRATRHAKRQVSQAQFRTRRCGGCGGRG